MMTNKKKILMICSVVPFPLRANGMALRYLPIIKKLHSVYHLDIVIIGDAAYSEIKGLENYCENYWVVEQPSRGRFRFIEQFVVNVMRLLPWSIPHAFHYYHAKRVKRNIIQVVGNDYDLILWVLSSHLTFLPEIKHALGIKKVIVDFIDSPSLLRQRQLSKRDRQSLMGLYELWKMKRWERNIRDSVDQVVYISDIDAATPGAIKADENVDVIPNGVNIEDYCVGSDVVYSGKTLGYLGNMSYKPNVEAVLWLYGNVLDKLDDKSVRLVVIGRDPDFQIQALSDDPRVIVTGEVENIWDYVNAVDVFALPIFTGAGLKNKVLEIMYSGKPLVTTSIGNDGIDAKDAVHLYLCESEEEFTERINVLFKNKNLRSRMSKVSREFVQDKFDSGSIIRKFMNIVESCFNSER
jgi:glycosyltransferase involved in cell wall biosynthesis